MSTIDLPFSAGCEALRLGDGITLLRGFARTTELLPLIVEVANAAPFRHLVTPGGQTMSVAMTNCGPVGWVSDRSGYRYSSRDPLTGEDCLQCRPISRALLLLRRPPADSPISFPTPASSTAIHTARA
jgi:alkylated DNA repair dioxygenase AlkB